MAWGRSQGASALAHLVVVCLLVPIVAACSPPGPGPAATVAPSTGSTSSGGAAAVPTAPAAATVAPAREVIATQGPISTPASQVTAAAKPTAVAPAASQAGSSATAAQTSDAVSFHPYATSDTASSAYQALVYSGDLVTYDPRTLEMVPDAAKSWQISEDKLTYTFVLRDDLAWSDGVPMTSADYKWTYDQVIKPENQYPYISNYAPIVSYDAPDPRTLVVKLKEPIAVGLETTSVVTPLPKHIWEALDWSDPQKNPQIMKPTVASGPYILQEWRKDERATFVANSRYHDGKPKIETFTYRIVPSTEVAYQMLKTGEVDFAGFSPDNYAEAKALPNVTVQEWWPAAASWRYSGYNLRRETWQDVRVRHALAHAIDREAIAEYILLNLAQPIDSVFPSTSWVYNPNVPVYEFSPDNARALLDDAGWTMGPGGVRQKDGKPLTMKLLYGPATSKTWERIAQVMQQSWGDVGVQVDIQTREWGTYLSELRSEPFDWDVNLGAWSSTIEPHFMQQIWMEASIPQLNASAYVNKRVEELFQQGVREFDREKRKQIYGEVQRILSEESPYIFLTFDKSYTGVSNRIGGIEPTPLGIGWNREQWFIK